MLGFGWRVTAFDPATRTGEIALHARRLRFERSAAADEDLRIDDPVYVRLLPASSTDTDPHVARVWPCLARVRGAAELPAAPPLDDVVAAATAPVVGHVRVPTELVVSDRGDGRVSVVSLLFDGLDQCIVGGHDVLMDGAIACSGARPTRSRSFEDPHVRIANGEERAVVHAGTALTRADIVIAIVEPRHEFSPERPAGVELVVCDRVTWQPAPLEPRSRAASDALSTALPEAGPTTSVIVDGRSLVAVTGTTRQRFFELDDDEEARAFDAWCAAVTVFLRED